MIRYVLCFFVCAVIWAVNVKEIIEGWNEGATSEIYMHTGLGVFLSLATIEWSLGIFRIWPRFDIFWLKATGFVLFIPSAFLVGASHYFLKQKGKTRTSKLSTTTVLVKIGIYRFVRQPMTLGMAIWSLALIMNFQSILSMILGAISLLCFWLSAVKENEYNIKKFGDAYNEYIKNVPMWNIIIGWIKQNRKTS